MEMSTASPSRPQYRPHRLPFVFALISIVSAMASSLWAANSSTSPAQELVPFVSHAIDWYRSISSFDQEPVQLAGGGVSRHGEPNFAAGFAIDF